MYEIIYISTIEIKKGHSKIKKYPNRLYWVSQIKFNHMNTLSYKILFLFSLILLVSISSCNRDDDDLELEGKEYPNVERALWPYFETFELEAEKRGFEVDLIERGIKGKVEVIEEENIGGLCNYHTDDANEVVINSAIWYSASELIKELILFHELGHCYLGRDHRDDAYDNNYCKSIMRSGVGGCDDHYTVGTRSSYLDELFDPDAF